MRRTAVGVDIGATLAKIAVDDGGDTGEGPHYELLPADKPDAVADRIRSFSPECVGLTGGGAARIAQRLPAPCTRVNEFAAWGAGAALLLDAAADARCERYLLVSLGTGTSVLLIDAGSATRVGGTALGGGTAVGLGGALVGTRDFEALCALAKRGDRASADLRVSDIYQAGEISLPGELTASCFGKLARRADETVSPEDLAAAVMGLVGENVALICAGLAAAAQVERIVFGGCTLRGNPVLANVLSGVTTQLGHTATLLAAGEFTGAIGSLEIARSAE